jgi:hypothetical protein
MQILFVYRMQKRDNFILKYMYYVIHFIWTSSDTDLEFSYITY